MRGGGPLLSFDSPPDGLMRLTTVLCVYKLISADIGSARRRAPLNSTMAVPVDS